MWQLLYWNKEGQKEFTIEENFELIDTEGMLVTKTDNDLNILEEIKSIIGENPFYISF